MVKLEADNVKLLTELKEARLALVEVDAAQSSLSASQEEVEKECMELRATIEMLKGENAQLVTDREAGVAAANKKF
jgi:peptidoglycan hydrolase CwlO-like protein